MNAKTLESAAREVAGRLTRAGHEAWFVGGCVRDRLLGLPLKDIDIATDARPDQVTELFPGARTVGARFAVVIVPHAGHLFEVATFRRDGIYLDHRHPSHVDFGTREEDTRRRDFTINALFQNPETNDVLDITGGREDLRSRLIRCVGDPRKRFNEDALRLIRAVRFAARFDFEMEALTWASLRDLAPTIQYVAPERLREELTLIFTGPNRARGLRLLDESGLLEWILPEVSAMKGVEQGAWHPEGDVFTHTCHVLEHLEPATTVNAWAALLHDVGKPVTFKRDDRGHITFYDHQNVGADMAQAIMERLRFPREEIEAVSSIVRRHMTFLNIGRMKRSTLRRFLSAPTIEGDLAVHRADCLGSGGGLAGYEFARKKLEEFRDAEEPLLPPPLLRGGDLLERGVAPGPRVGRILAEAQELQLEGAHTSREEALAWLESRLREGGK